MHVDRIGFASVKGTRHRARPEVELSLAGPVGDRELCLVDPSRARVLRTVEHPTLLQAVVDRVGDRLRVTLPSGTVEAALPAASAEVAVDYWGRQVRVGLLDGPWSDAFADHLGVEARLAQVRHAGAVVYAGSVSLVGTGSVAALAARLGRPLDPARFRSTLVVDTGAAGPHVEDGWVGGTLRVGGSDGAVLRVSAPVPRCAVVDLDPDSGARDVPALATLAGYRRAAGEIRFGVDAEVVRPGRIHVDDQVTWEGS